MFVEYLQDAHSFYTLAKQGKTERESKMYFRASVFCACAAVEAFINFIGDSQSKGNKLDKNEISFLNDRVLEISPSKGAVEEKTRFQSLDNKIKFLIVRFNVSFDISTSPEWAHFNALKDLRDTLIHARETDDPNTVNVYSKKIRSGLNANIEIMNAISKKLFSKPLSKKLNDLKL